MPFANAQHTRVHYELDGTGPGLALLHGVGGDAEKVFGNVVEHFTDTRTVIRPNFSGSGDTEDNGSELSVDLLVEQAAASIRDGSDGPVDLLGFSLGAVVAAAVSATHPELVRRLVLAGGWTHSTGPRDRFYFETWRKLADTDRELLKRFSALTGYSAAALDRFGHEGLAWWLTDSWPPAGINRQIDLAGRVDIRPLLPKITAPTLVVGFGKDGMVPVEGSRQLHESIQGSQLVEVPDEGHMDWFGDPSGLVKLARDFLDK